MYYDQRKQRYEQASQIGGNSNDWNDYLSGRVGSPGYGRIRNEILKAKTAQREANRGRDLYGHRKTPKAPPPQLPTANDMGFSAEDESDYFSGRVGTPGYNRRRSYDFLQRKLRGYASGGQVFNAMDGGLVPPGPPGVDTVPAMTSNGPAMLDSQAGPGGQEYVLPADTTATIGIPNLDAIKNATHNPQTIAQRQIPGYCQGGKMRKYASGGAIYDDEEKRKLQPPSPGPSAMQEANAPRAAPVADKQQTLRDKWAGKSGFQMLLENAAETQKHPLWRPLMPEGLRGRGDIGEGDVKYPEQSRVEKTPPSTLQTSANRMEQEIVGPPEQRLPAGVRQVQGTQAYAYDVPKSLQGEYGRAIYSNIGEGKGATPEGFKAPLGPSQSAPTYGGYDLSSLTPAERSEFKRRYDRHVGDIEAATYWLSLPQMQRGNPTQAVQRGLADTSPAEEVLNQAEARASQARQAQSAQQAALLGKQIEASGKVGAARETAAGVIQSAKIKAQAQLDDARAKVPQLTVREMEAYQQALDALDNAETPREIEAARAVAQAVIDDARRRLAGTQMLLNEQMYQ